MQRINLSIDVEDDKVLGEQIKKAILSQAKQISREAIAKELQSEIERIVTSKLNELKSPSYYNSITSQITDLLVKRLDNDILISREDIDAKIEEKVTAYLDTKIQRKNGLEGFIQKYIDKSIASALLERAKD